MRLFTMITNRVCVGSRRRSLLHCRISTLTVSDVALEREKKEEACQDVRPPDHARHGLSVDGMGGEEHPSQQHGQFPLEQQLGGVGEHPRHHGVQDHVGGVEPGGVEAPQGMVQPEGEYT